MIREGGRESTTTTAIARILGCPRSIFDGGLLKFVVEAEKGGFTTTRTSDHLHP